MKILILTPNLSNPGGVSSLYKILKLDKNKHIEYFDVQGKKRKNSILKLWTIFTIYTKFTIKIFDNQLIHLNPSFDKRSFYRDGILLLIARILRKKIIVYWHGWNLEFQKSITPGKLSNLFFKTTFKKAQMHIVLGNVFKIELIKMGIDKNIIKIESNAADDYFLERENVYLDPKKDKIELLFIARIEETKGVFIALKTMLLLNKRGNYSLTIAGDGPALLRAKEFVFVNKIENVTFVGQVKDEIKHKVFRNSEILLFPTYYPEGMPISIIESMLYGLVIISRPIAGIPDWVKVPDNGFLIESLDESEYADRIEQLSKELNLMNQIQENNRKFAKEYFTPKSLQDRLNNYYASLLMSK